MKSTIEELAQQLMDAYYGHEPGQVQLINTESEAYDGWIAVAARAKEILCLTPESLDEEAGFVWPEPQTAFVKARIGRTYTRPVFHFDPEID